VYDLEQFRTLSVSYVPGSIRILNTVNQHTGCEPQSPFFAGGEPEELNLLDVPVQPEKIQILIESSGRGSPMIRRRIAMSRVRSSTSSGPKEWFSGVD
jgi:hypothetical protein